MHQVDAEHLHQGQHHGHEYVLDRGDVHHAAQEQEHHVDDQQEQILVVGQAHHPVGDGDGHLLAGDDVAEQQARAGQQRQRGGVGGGLLDDVEQLFKAHAAIHQEGDQQRPGGGQRAGLGGGADAGIDAAQQQHHREQRGRGHDGGLQEGLEAHAYAGGIVALFGDEEHVDGQQERQQHAGHHAAHEQLAHRRAGEHGVDDHGDRRREDGADGGRGGGDGAGEGGVVALGLHLLDLHHADAAGVRHGGAGHAGEDQGNQHVHLGRAALQPAQQAVAEGEHAVGDVRFVQHVGHEDEQRRGQHRVVGEHVAGQHRGDLAQLRRSLDDEVDDGGGQHGEGDRHADQEADDHRREYSEYRPVHAFTPLYSSQEVFM